MAKILSFNDKRNGSYIDSVSKLAGTNTNGVFAKAEKGLSLLLGSNGNVSYGSILNTELAVGQNFTGECWFKLNDVTTRQAIWAFSNSGGDRYVLGVESGTIRWSELGGTEKSSSAIKANVWYHCIFSQENTTMILLINLVNQVGVTANGNHYIDNVFRIGSATSPGSNQMDGYVAKLEFYNHIFTTQERSNAYRNFLQAGPMLSEKYPRVMPEDKPTDLSKESDKGLIAAYNMIPTWVADEPGVIVDLSGGPVNNQGVILPVGGAISTKDGLLLDGIDDTVDFGNIGNVKTVAFRIKLASTTEKILEGAANDLLIHVNAGALTYTDYDNAFINGQDLDIIPATYQWLNIVITSTTDVNNTAVTLGLNNTTYGKFEIADLKFYDYEFTQAQAEAYHNQFAKRVVLKEDFHYDPVGSTLPTGWKAGTGTYAIAELATQDSVLKELDVGTKYLENTVAGTIAIPSKQAYGEWEFDFYKGADANVSFMYPILDKPNDLSDIASGYYLSFTGGEGAVFQRVNPGANTNIFTTVASYITINTWYGIKITRTLGGVFTVYIKGGAFGDVYTMIVETSGANPSAADNTYTTSEYFVLDLDAGDKIGPITITEGVVQ